jgi:hypothetical protein
MHENTDGILKAAKAIYDVREKISKPGSPSSSFGGWAEEELKRSPSTASALAVIGARYGEFSSLKTNLPPSWYTLYVLASEGDDRVFKAAMRRVTPETTRVAMFPRAHEPPTRTRRRVTCPRRTRAGPEPAPRGGSGLYRLTLLLLPHEEITI